MNPMVYLVDDDDALRDALRQLLEGAGLRVLDFASAEAFMPVCESATAGCLVLDLRMPGMSGPELHAALRDRGMPLPIIYLTGHGDVPTAVRALQSGAFDFIEKPPPEGVLVERVRKAIDWDERRRSDAQRDAAARASYARLTPREREVMAHIVAGRSTKEAARELGISHRTVDVYRQRVMAKTGAANLIELSEFARRCAMPRAERRRPSRRDDGH
ncbi:MAG: response regulator [Betaproteobacteria bacterium]|nr:response regulator [Betaproteobacteria bacterium]